MGCERAHRHEPIAVPAFVFAGVMWEWELNLLLSSPGLTGRSSTPRLIGSIIDVSGILGRPVKPGDDS